MSLFPREYLRVALTADHVCVECVRCVLGGTVVVARREIECAAGQGAAQRWRAAVDLLADALPALRGNARTSRVTLSDHHVRQILLPWRDDLRGDAELQAYARVRLAEVYGAAGAEWTVKVAVLRYRSPYLACAVQRDLLSALGAVHGKHGIRLAAVRPLLTDVYNAWDGRHAAGRWWFAVVQRGRYTLCRVDEGAWLTLCSEKRGEDLRNDVRRSLERECISAGIEAAAEVVHMFGAQRDGAGSAFAQPERLALGEAAPVSSRRGVRWPLSLRRLSSVDVDFAQRRAWGLPQAVLLAAGLGASAAVLQAYAQLRDETGVLQAEVARHDRAQRRARGEPDAAPASPAAQQELRRADATIRQISLPWEPLFETLEITSGAGVALLSVQPDPKAEQVTISGEAKSYDELLSYTERLAQTKLLDRVYLTGHEVKQRDSVRPVAFSLAAHWQVAK